MDRHDKNTTARKIMEMYISHDFPDHIELEAKQWLAGNIHAGIKDDVLWDMWNTLNAAHGAGDEATLRRIKKDLGMNIGRRIPRRNIIRITAAAAVLACVVVSALWMTNTQGTEPTEQVVAKVITTGEGERRHAELEDGTSMWLNAGSRATYTDAREIALSGEGFFEVTQRDGEKFSVASRDVTAVVTGTSFNFRSFDQEQKTVITLFEGSLTIDSPDTVVLLSAGQEFQYGHENSTVSVTETYRTQPEWLRDIVDLGDMSIAEVFSRLERIYGTSIEAGGLTSLTDKVELKFEGGLPLEDVMSILAEISGKFSYMIDRGKVYVWD